MNEDELQPTRRISMDSVLKGAAAGALMIASCSVGYYYAFFLPERAQARDRELARERIAKEQATERIEKQKEDAATRRRDGYRVCLSSADFAYSNRWNASCKVQHDSDVAARDRCLQNGYDEAYCRGSYSVRPETDCTLANGLADDYDRDHHDAREQCRAEAASDLTL